MYDIENIDKIKPINTFYFGVLVIIYILLLTALRQLSFISDHATGKNVLINGF